MGNFFKELKRRHVIKATIAYLVVAWILIQVATILLDTFNAPDWIIQSFTILLAIGLPIWIIISWIYDITPEGIEVTAKDSEKQIAKEITNKRLNVFIIVSLSIAVIVLALNQTVFSSDPNKEYSIAVIPFNNIKVDEGNEWLSQNFTQSVNSYISKIKKLQVIDSYSTSQYENSVKTNAEIGDELKVSYVIRGNVTQLKNKLSITVELIDVISNTVIWSDSFDEIIEEDETLKLPQDVSERIVTKLKVHLSPEDKNALTTLLTNNQEASIFFTEGKRIADERTPKDMDSILSISAGWFQKAIDLDPNYADAYAEMAFVLRLISEEHAIFKNTDKFKKIDSLLKRSLEINPNTVRAYTTLGMMQMSRAMNWAKAKEHFDKALAIKPNDASTHHYYALYYRDKPDPDFSKEIEHIKKAYRLNPFSVPINAIMVINLLRSEKILEAEEFYKKNNHVFADEDPLKYVILWAKVKGEVNENKDWREAIKIYHKEIEKNPNDSYLHRTLAKVYNEVSNNNLNYLKYAKRAYELGALYSENDDLDWMSSNADMYFFALLKNKKFKDAENLLQDDYFKSLFSGQRLYYLEFYLYYYQGNYQEAQVSMDRYIYGNIFELTMNFAQQNNVRKVDSIVNKGGFNAYQKAMVFAILKEKDSMYYNIEKEKDTNRILQFNGSIEVDPYRKEERYKAFLKKHYLPITHWNE